ncbi:MAG TPA: DUF2269 family protein [Candidatus Eremiobacteraceae bacterium]|nr:DUF2269 family protein [Candidatus Eremiobacteraceae bacterium]
MIYLLFKLLHIAGAIAFVGNIVIGIFWKLNADRTRDPAIIANATAGINRADLIFTFPGIFALLIGGFGAAGVAHISIIHTGWILWGLGLFLVSGIAFGPTRRAQREMQTIAEAGAKSGTMDWAAYDAATARWNVAGMIATITPLLALVVMVLKPALPAF